MKVHLVAEIVDVLQQLQPQQVNFGMMLTHTDLLDVMQLMLTLTVGWVSELQLVASLFFGTFDKDLCLILDKDLDKTGKPLTLSYVMSYVLLFSLN